MRILFTGGGTGGHITPIAAVARQLKQIYRPEIETHPKEKQAGLKLYFLGAKGPKGFENVLTKEGIKTKIVLAGKFRRYLSLRTLLDLIKLPLGLVQSVWYLFVWMPDAIFNKGGFGSAPIVLIGWLYRIPIITHESDTIPGLATRLGGKLSKRIAISFSEAGKYFPAKKTTLIGNPIRMELLQACLSTNEADRITAKNILQIVSQKPIVLILGGSQGAQKIDELVLSSLPQLSDKYEIIHQCRTEDYEKIKEEVKSIGKEYHLFSFLNENQLKAAFLLAQVVVSRAGAASIFEIAGCAKPSILIPLPTAASNHQRENAFAYAKTGATSILEQTNLTPNIFINEIDKIVNNPDLAMKMSQNARNFAIPEAAQKIAEELLELGK